MIISYAGWRSVLILIAASLLVACRDAAPSDVLAKAAAQIERAEYAAAIVHLKGQLATREKSPQARYLLGKALLASGDAFGAVVELNKALELGAEPADAVPELARAMLRSGRSHQLLQRYGDAQLSRPRATADLYTSLALAYAFENDKARSEAALRTALAADPAYAPAQLALARIAAAAGKFDDALETLVRLAATKQMTPEAWHLQGEILRVGKRQIGDAAKAFEASVEADPSFIPGHAALAALALQSRNIPLLRSRVAAMAKVAPKNLRTHYYSAQLLLIDKQIPAARSAVEQLLRVAPNDLSLLALAGAIELSGDALLRAESYLGKALSLAPGQATVRMLLASTYLRAGDSAKCLSTLAPMLEARSPDAQALGLAAEAHLQAGDPAKAEALFKQASLANPLDVRYQTAIALTKIQRGETSGGLVELETIASTDTTAFADMALLAAKLRTGDRKGAINAADSLERKRPKSPLPAMARGRVLMEQKDAVGARKNFERALELEKMHLPAAYALAELDLADRRLGNASQRFESILKLEPRNYRARLALADVKTRGGANSAEVRAVLDEAVRLSPDELAPRLSLIQHLLSARQSKEAVASANVALAAIPENLELIGALGTAQLASGESQQALASLRKVAAALPNNPLPLLRLAEAHASLGDRQAAQQILRQALLLSPRLLAAQRSLTVLAAAEGRWSEALSVAKTVQRQRPTRPEGFQWEGSVHLGQRNWTQATAAFRAAMGRAKTSDTAALLHTALESASKRAEADRFADEWLTQHKGDATFLSYLGDAANSKGDFALAETRYKAAVELTPGNIAALNNLAWVMAKQRKPGAAAYAERANKLAPNNPDVLDTLAFAVASENNPGEALKIQQRAVSLAPNTHALRLQLAKLAIQAGDKTLARSELEKLAYLGDKFALHAQVTTLIQELK